MTVELSYNLMKKYLLEGLGYIAGTILLLVFGFAPEWALAKFWAGVAVFMFGAILAVYLPCLWSLVPWTWNFVCSAFKYQHQGLGAGGLFSLIVGSLLMGLGETSEDHFWGLIMVIIGCALILPATAWYVEEWRFRSTRTG